MGKKQKKTQECLNNIRIRFPTQENECYTRRTRILRTMVDSIVFGNNIMKRRLHVTLNDSSKSECENVKGKEENIIKVMHLCVMNEQQCR